MISEGLAEPDDAYREATEILSGGGAEPSLCGGDRGRGTGYGRAGVPPDPGYRAGDLSGDRNSIFIVGDAHQRIYARRASMSACGINVRGRSRRLRLNYRTTQEIRAWAVSILEGVSVDDLDEGTDTLRGYVSLFQDRCRTRAVSIGG